MASISSPASRGRSASTSRQMVLPRTSRSSPHPTTASAAPVRAVIPAYRKCLELEAGNAAGASRRAGLPAKALMQSKMRCLLLILLLSLWVAPTYAHKPSDSYLMLSVKGDHLTGQWDIALRDLDYAIELDANGNGEITWGEVKAKHTEIAAYVLAHLAIAADGARCAISVTEHLIDNHSDGAYEVMRFAADCPAAPLVLTIKYTLFFDLDPQHRGLLRFEEQGRTHLAVFSPDRQTWQWEGQSVGLGSQFRDFFGTGVWHIWTGFDHILFLCALLLPAVLEHRGGRWQAVTTFRKAFLDVISIVTAFTIAHSITLSLAVF